jgi:ubiquinone/menaquinone biosynthesis C-methylase UbiE
MQRTDTVFAGSIPALYDRYLAPVFFEPYARDLATRVRALEVRHLLEIAAGTGVVTRELVRALPDNVQIVATDLNEAMIAHAAARLETPNVAWSTADARALPFPDRLFDAVVCQFGVMFFDRARGFGEVRRVLVPGGTFVFSVWDRIEHNDLTRIVSEAVANAFPDDPPRFFERTPHGHYDTAAIERDLHAAGFDEVTVEAIDARSRAPSASDVAIGLCQGTPLRNEIVARDPGALPAATERATRALIDARGEGGIDGGMRAFVITAR